MSTFVFFDFYKNDIISDLADAFPWNNESAFSSKQAAEFAGAWNDQRFDLSCFAVEFNINGAAKTFTGADVNDFFCFQLTKTHKITVFFWFMQSLCRKGKFYEFILLTWFHDYIIMNLIKRELFLT